MEELLNELKTRIIDVLNLVDVTPEDFQKDGPLVGGDLGIDSIDVLEMVMMIEQEYGVVIDNKEVGERVFATIETLVSHIYKHSPRFAN
jgi:acyl carrier protein